jgi:alpha-glucosidase
MKILTAAALSLILIVTNHSAASAQSAVSGCTITQADRGVHLASNDGVIDVELLQANILRVDVQPEGKRSPRTIVMDPALKPAEHLDVSIRDEDGRAHLKTSQLDVAVSCSPEPDIAVSDGEGHKLVEQANPLAEARGHRATFLHAPGENLYGMSGLSMRENGGGLLRNNGSAVTAGQQGEGGAPWFFTTHYGVLIDSDDGSFDTRDQSISFSGDSQQDVEYFVMSGPPMQLMSALATLTGRPPLPPKWTLGFLNSQWGSTEAEIKQIVATYRAKHIPLDAFILDFDWKAWGEDNYGEWRWNSTSGAGNVHPDKFPDGASGLFARELGEQGVKLAGILKPRILLYKPGSTTELMDAASYAQEHDLWYAGEPKMLDYFTLKPARDLDFRKPETRAWYWQHLQPTFDEGMVAWWNDEADVTGTVGGGTFNFDSFQFLNMGRMIYDGQRSHSNVRVWTINRNYYLGAQRYGYAEWSGDIQTGFQSMQHQRMRMLATLDLGEPHWSMDTGGFVGHPTPENYARWLEFAAFVPIDRVHGDLNQKRQPWVYGPTAEAAATRAIRLRYELLPYIYSYERGATETGVGIVRPLFWIFPHDPQAANDGASWMFGDAFLVSPVVEPGESVHTVYLPAGEWFDYFRGTRIAGAQTLHYKVDPQTWQDIPLFVRAGSIIASQPTEDYVDEHPMPEITLDIFPAARPAEFTYYDDDGTTYAYEQGAYNRQVIRASQAGGTTRLDFAQPTGSFRPALRSFIVCVHGVAAGSVTRDGRALSKAAAGSRQAQLKVNQWMTAHDRFGSSTIIRVPANTMSSILVH